MISYKLVENMSFNEIQQCNNLINNSFKTNRFNDYVHAIMYIKENQILGFVGIYDSLLNQLCTHVEYRKQGIASKLLEACKTLLNLPIFLFIDKKKDNTEYLVNFYKKNQFFICDENNIEYKMIFK
jgi:ribosomal protein S18 acetylase RimI-like enzyme